MQDDSALIPQSFIQASQNMALSVRGHAQGNHRVHTASVTCTIYQDLGLTWQITLLYLQGPPSVTLAEVQITSKPS